MCTIHLDLLNDIDEVNQCKRSMRLARHDEDLTLLTNDELNSIVVALDIPIRLADHSAKQAMALGMLRRYTQNLRFLTNVKVRECTNDEKNNNNNGDGDDKEDTTDGAATNCIVCLSAMTGERAVLNCGHSFHPECIKPLVSNRDMHAMISCPLRCTTKTKKMDIMIATSSSGMMCQHDGAPQTRDIKGSWGTKVTRLVCVRPIGRD